MTTDLKMLRDAEICACNADELVDLRNVEVDRNMPLKERTGDYIAQVGNPYLFKVGETVVKVAFGGGKAFTEMLTDAVLAG